jgi:hypothetical protein
LKKKKYEKPSKIEEDQKIWKKSQNGQYYDKVFEQDLHVANQRKSFISYRRTER